MIFSLSIYVIDEKCDLQANHVQRYEYPSVVFKKIVMNIMWLPSQSHFYLLFIFVKMNFYSLSFLCDVCNEVYEHM